MASRDIASMHFFLEMKRIFPELPEDIIRKNIYECQNDHQKCLHHLRKEKEKYQCYKQSFSEYLSSSHETGRSDYHTNCVKLQQNENTFTPKSTVHEKCELSEKVIFVNNHLNHRVKPNVSSTDATEETKFVSVMYKNHVKPGFVSQTLSLLPKVQQRNHFMNVSSPVSNSEEFSCKSHKNVSPNSSYKQHRVTLSFVPNLPCSERTTIPESRICPSTSDRQGHGRHVTSIHLELHPDTAKPAVNISTISNNTRSKDKQKYDSCIHISFTSHGTTFSAQRTGFSSEMSLYNSRNGNLSNTEIESNIAVKPKNVLKSSKFPLYSHLRVPVGHCGSSQHSVLPPNLDQPSISRNGSMETGHPTDRCPSHSMYNHYEKNHRKIIPVDNEEQMPNRNSQPYVQAVIHHQKLRLEMLKKELEKEKFMFCQISNEVNEMEKSFQSQGNKKSCSLSILPKMAVLTEENKLVKEECKKLFTELRKLEKTGGDLFHDS